MEEYWPDPQQIAELISEQDKPALKHQMALHHLVGLPAFGLGLHTAHIEQKRGAYTAFYSWIDRLWDSYLKRYKLKVKTLQRDAAGKLEKKEVDIPFNEYDKKYQEAFKRVANELAGSYYGGKGLFLRSDETGKLVPGQLYSDKAEVENRAAAARRKPTPEEQEIIGRPEKLIQMTTAELLKRKASADHPIEFVELPDIEKEHTEFMKSIYDNLNKVREKTQRGQIGDIVMDVMGGSFLTLQSSLEDLLKADPKFKKFSDKISWKEAREFKPPDPKEAEAAAIEKMDVLTISKLQKRVQRTGMGVDPVKVYVIDDQGDQKMVEFRQSYRDLEPKEALAKIVDEFSKLVGTEFSIIPGYTAEKVTLAPADQILDSAQRVSSFKDTKVSDALPRPSEVTAEPGTPEYSRQVETQARQKDYSNLDAKLNGGVWRLKVPFKQGGKDRFLKAYVWLTRISGKKDDVPKIDQEALGWNFILTKAGDRPVNVLAYGPEAIGGKREVIVDAEFSGQMRQSDPHEAVARIARDLLKSYGHNIEADISEGEIRSRVKDFGYGIWYVRVPYTWIAWTDPDRPAIGAAEESGKKRHTPAFMVSLFSRKGAPPATRREKTPEEAKVTALIDIFVNLGVLDDKEAKKKIDASIGSFLSRVEGTVKKVGVIPAFYWLRHVGRLEPATYEEQKVDVPSKLISDPKTAAFRVGMTVAAKIRLPEAEFVQDKSGLQKNVIVSVIQSIQDVSRKAAAERYGSALKARAEQEVPSLSGDEKKVIDQAYEIHLKLLSADRAPNADEDKVIKKALEIGQKAQKPGRSLSSQEVTSIGELEPGKSLLYVFTPQANQHVDEARNMSKETFETIRKSFKKEEKERGHKADVEMLAWYKKLREMGDAPYRYMKVPEGGKSEYAPKERSSADKPTPLDIPKHAIAGGEKPGYQESKAYNTVVRLIEESQRLIGRLRRR